MTAKTEKSIIVCDLDGTLFNTDHRVHLAQSKQWEEFHLASENDEVYEDVALFLDRATQFWDFTIIYLTGCNERFRNLKNKILSRHILNFGELVMRPDDDWRPDVVVKPELLENFMKENGYKKEDIWVILEDRDKVVEMWRNLGYCCWQTRLGGY